MSSKRLEWRIRSISHDLRVHPSNDTTARLFRNRSPFGDLDCVLLGSDASRRRSCPHGTYSCLKNHDKRVTSVCQIYLDRRWVSRSHMVTKSSAFEHLESHTIKSHVTIPQQSVCLTDCRDDSPDRQLCSSEVRLATPVSPSLGTLLVSIGRNQLHKVAIA